MKNGKFEEGEVSQGFLKFRGIPYSEARLCLYVHVLIIALLKGIFRGGELSPLLPPSVHDNLVEKHFLIN